MLVTKAEHTRCLSLDEKASPFFQNLETSLTFISSFAPPSVEKSAVRSTWYFGPFAASHSLPSTVEPSHVGSARIDSSSLILEISDLVVFLAKRCRCMPCAIGGDNVRARIDLFRDPLWLPISVL